MRAIYWNQGASLPSTPVVLLQQWTLASLNTIGRAGDEGSGNGCVTSSAQDVKPVTMSGIGDSHIPTVVRPRRFKLSSYQGVNAPTS